MALAPIAPHPLQPFWNLAVAPVQVEGLALALEHDLFTLLATPAPAAAIAARLQWNAGAAQAWLDLLWGLQLLQRDADGYRSTALAIRWFTPGSADNCLQAWRFRASAFASAAPRLGAMLRSEPATAEGAQAPTLGDWASAAQVQIGQEQQAITVPETVRILQALDALPAQGRLLDLGGGPGWVAIALATASSRLHAVVFDLPQPAHVAAANIAQAGLQSRVQAMGGNLDHDDFGSGYDLVWCSSVLHFVADPVALLRRVLAALRPGGRLVIVHAERPDTADASAALLPFYLPMALRGSFVPHAGDTARLMRDAGFSDVQSHGHAQMAMAPLPVYSGTRR